jgi:hypothetical protein
MSGSRRLVVVWSRIIGLLPVLVALAVLQGCSAVKLAYNNAPEVAYWWLDAYADLDDAQTLKVRSELARLHLWHRSAELPKVADLLHKTRQFAPADTTPDQVCNLFAETRRRVDALLAQAEAGTVDVAMRLTPAQIAHVEAKFAKTDTEWRDEWLAGTVAERHARRLKASVERSEQFYGTLDERQVALLRASIQQSGFDPQLSYAEKLRRQRDIVQTLRLLIGAVDGSRPTVTQATSVLRATLERSFNSPNAAYRAYADQALADSCRAFAQLHNSTSPEQRERAVRRLAAYERDARELSLPN